MKEYIKYRNQFSYREGLYKSITKEFSIKRALYPGSHIDIAPSFFVPDMTYIDNFKGAIKFFENMKEVHEYIIKEKTYKSPPMIFFYGKDYTQVIDISEVDLIISQYAGFVGQATKKYLKPGGILLANDSHGDATLAYLDDDFDFIGVISSHGKISYNNLEKYFTFKRERPINKEKVLRTMKGPKYKHDGQNYIFKYKS